ncbi:N-terminal domain of NEFA-interacting nuclear protein NIP30-domain-containing protein [Pilobolus umbonatus]|nr:N-terminal domain of NEFA-interacting nuclear protein NIP30-domain-containing protein [Pilobolus umbonatus]
MSFNIKSSFVTRSVVENNKEELLDNTEINEVVQEEYDPRTLYERLQEQRTIKEEKFQEESRLANQIKRVDEEEVEYFNTLSDEKEKLEHQIKLKERQELEEYRKAVEDIRSNPATQLPNALIPKPTTAPKPLIKPRKLLKNAVKGLVLLKKKGEKEDESFNRKENESSKKREDDQPVKKQKTSNGSLSLLSAYGDNSDESSEEE